MTLPQPFGEPTQTPAVDELFDEGHAVDDGDVLYEDQVTPEYGILGFTLRELIILGLWLIAFVVSFITSGSTVSLWSQGITWILPIGLPTVAVFLIVLRRLSPEGIRRVGSLGIDQFASVAFSVAALWWAQALWAYVAAAITTGSTAVIWVPWVAFAATLGLVVVSVFAFLIPGLREDFQGRLETLAHRNANPVRPVIARPRAPKPEAPASAAAAESATIAEPEPAELPFVAYAPAELDVELSGENATDEIARLDGIDQIPLSAHASGGSVGGAVGDDDYVPGYARRSRQEAEPDEEHLDPAVAPIVALGFDEVEIVDDAPIDDAVTDAEPAAASIDDAASAVFDEEIVTRAVDIDATNPRTAPAAQPFWALAPTERDVFDEQGQPLFRIGPTAWALVIEDRGGAYVVRHDDGRIGYLHDIADITKG